MSSIREFYLLHRPEVHRHGLAVALLIAAMATGRWPLAGLIFLGLPVMHAYDRWGESWRQRGEQMMKRKPKP